MTARFLFALFAALSLAPAAAVAQTDAKLSVARNAAGEVLITVSATIPACGLTALNEAPTFKVEGTTIKVHQPIVGVACMNPPPKEKHYERVLNVGSLGQGNYTIEWSFPAVTGTVPASAR